MFIVSVAVGVGLSTHAGLPGWSASAIAIAALIAMLALGRGRGGQCAAAPRPHDVVHDADEAPQSGRAHEGSPALTPWVPDPVATLPHPTSDVFAPRSTAAERPAPRLGSAVHPLGAGDPMQTYWSVVPQHLERAPIAQGSDVKAIARPVLSAGPSSPPERPQVETVPHLQRPAAPPRESDVEMIQGLIKKLADEVNAAEQAPLAVMEDLPAPRVYNALPHVPPVPPAGAEPAGAEWDEPAKPSSVEAAVGSSLDALQFAAGSMRSRSLRADVEASAALAASTAALEAAAQRSRFSEPALVAPPPLPRSSTTVAAGVAALADAIASGRVEVLLEPILSLDQQRAHHYEVSIRLKDANGNALDGPLLGGDLNGSGLLPLFDAAKIARTTNVARRLQERGKSGSVFSSYSGESLSHGQFVADVAGALRERASVARTLVMSFSLKDVRGFGASEWATLADMRALGFRFAVEAVTDLDFDAAALVRAGFSFAKLDAGVLLSGLPSLDATVPPSDVCRRLAEQGLTLVVNEIADERQLAQIFGFGVLFGQGQLFGGPRPMKAEASAAAGTAAA